MKLGVNTHFEQGWPIAALAKAEAVGTQGIREAIAWGKIEKQRGVYTFTVANSGFLDAICGQSIPTLLVIAPRNPIYDNARAVTSEAGRKALAKFVRTIVERFSCIDGVEIGNEINAASPLWPPATEKPKAYVAILKAIRQELNGMSRQVALVGGSSLSVATGFQNALFAAGMLPLVDAISVHPYSETPEQLPFELDRLKDIMKKHGGIKPIWSTEFGLYYKTPEAAPPHALKVITIMSAAHVDRAYWYALLDEKWYPNMGLFVGSAAKPARDMFVLSIQRLLKDGNARRIDQQDPLSFIYQFGNGTYVMWGDGRTISFDRPVKAFDARGHEITIPSELIPEPVVITGPANFTLGPSRVIADTLNAFGDTGWSRSFAIDGKLEKPMQWIDWIWAPYLGLSDTPNFKATASWVQVSGSAAHATSLVERYTASAAGKYWLSACFLAPRHLDAIVSISTRGRDLFAGTVGATEKIARLAITLRAGENVDIRYKAVADKTAIIRRRIRLLTQPDTHTALCRPTAGETRQ